MIDPRSNLASVFIFMCVITSIGKYIFYNLFT